MVDQSFQAGFAELAKGVLHNLGNAMTPLGVRLATLEERLRAARQPTWSWPAASSPREKPASARRADLEEFLRLGCRAMAATVREAQADVALVQRQAAIVQSALSELMRSTRNDHIVEAVRLPELVTQTLEIVPDACRQRLIVDADESLAEVGVVRVARMVLRLILQNLIINAADAVRDAGRTQGNLRVAAEIVRESDREQLHLHCRDNGVGISQGQSAARVREGIFDQVARYQLRHRIALVRQCGCRSGRANLGRERGPGARGVAAFDFAAGGSGEPDGHEDCGGASVTDSKRVVDSRAHRRR